MKNTRKIYRLIFWLSCVLYLHGWGKVEHAKDSLVAGAIVAGQSKTVSDRFYSEYGGAYNYTNYKVNSRVSLMIDPKKTAGIAVGTPTQVPVTIDYYIWESGAMQARQQVAMLSVTYAAVGSYTQASYVDLGAAYQVKVTLGAVSGVNAASKLVLEIVAERYYQPSGTVSGLTVTAPDVMNNQLGVSWTVLPNVEYYELEWAPVESHLSVDQNHKPVETTDLSKIPLGTNYLKNNSSRISTEKSQYDIPLVYEKGYLICRVRAVYYAIVGGNKVERYTAWTASDDKQVLSDIAAAHRIKIPGFEDKKNWQYMVSYAEGGKNKAAVSFADGTLRKRQEAIRLNTEKKTLVGDIIYDHQGRPVINTLPVPTLSSSLKYRERFSQNGDEDAYNRSNFDLDQSPNDCTSPTDAMKSTQSGAAQYYSSNNPFGESQVGGEADKIINRNAIPNAGGYPFSQTTYMPDPTNRVAAVTTPGASMKLGSGHETQMFYGTPTQEELYRLFGNDVGNAMHYQKNLVRDPNGQYTVSYIDMQGRTIATSLAGEGPSQLKKLNSNVAQETITSDLLGDQSDKSPNKKTPDGKGYEFSKSLAIIGGNKYKLDYKVTSGFYRPTVCPDICYGCVVDIETSFKEKPCANNLSKVPSFSFRKQTSGCNAVDSNANMFDGTIQEGGTYLLSKKLKINEVKLEQYTKDYLSKPCVKKLKDFIDDEMAKADPNWCGLSCEQCKDKFTQEVGTYAQWAARHNPTPLEEEYNRLRDQACVEYCDTKWNECSMALELMLKDMSPMGQYGEIYEKSFKTGTGDGAIAITDGMVEVSTGTQVPSLTTGANGGNDETTDFDFGKFNPQVHRLSIYKTVNYLPRREIPGKGVVAPSWRKPYLMVYGVALPLYLNEDSTRSIIPVKERVNGSGIVEYSPEVLDPSKIVREANRAPYIYPENLKLVSDFTTKYWKDSWARSLVVYHPEYPYYQACIENMASVKFDQKWNNTYNLQTAEDNQLMNRAVEKFNPVALDPYFNSGRKIDSLIMTWRLKKFQKGSSGQILDIWTLTNKAVNCPTSKSCALGCSDTKIDSDKEWQTFKTLYASLKQEIVRRNSQRKAIREIYYNGCIGNANYDPTAYGFSDLVEKEISVTRYRTCQNWWDPLINCQPGPYTYSYEQPYVAVADPAQYCSYYFDQWYAKKTKRFWQEPALGGSLGTSSEGKCFDTVRVNAIEIEYVPVRCADDVQAFEEELRAENTRKVYDECGVCPLVWDLEHFLGDMARKNKLALASADLSCPPAQGVTSFTPLLERAYVSGNATLSSNRIQYTSVLSSDGKSLSIKLLEEGGGVPASPHIILTIPTSSPYNFSQITDLCCMEIVATSSPALAGKLFKFNGKVKVGFATIKVPISGMSSVALDPCEIPMRCLPSNKSIQVLKLLNALRTHSPDKPNHLVNANAVELIGQGMYNASIRQLENKDAFENGEPEQGYEIPNADLSYKWSSSIVAGKLVGTIAYEVKQNGQTVTGSRLIELIPPSGTTVDFTKIVNFSNIKMKKCTTEGCVSTTFTIDVQFRNTNTGEMSTVTLDGNSSYVMGQCKAAVKFGSSKK